MGHQLGRVGAVGSSRRGFVEQHLGPVEGVHALGEGADSGVDQVAVRLDDAIVVHGERRHHGDLGLDLMGGGGDDGITLGLLRARRLHRPASGLTRQHGRHDEPHHAEDDGGAHPEDPASQDA
jgi:hypothetical protein